MPRNFSTADRETVRTAVKEQPWALQVSTCGTGVVVQLRNSRKDTYNKTFESLMRKFGWYVDSMFPDESGGLIVLMPVTEVPE